MTHSTNLVSFLAIKFGILLTATGFWSIILFFAVTVKISVMPVKTESRIEFSMIFNNIR